MSRAVEEERKSVRDELNTILVPLGFSPVVLCTPLLGGWNVIWYWGKETGFAAGRTAEAVAASAQRQVFGGL